MFAKCSGDTERCREKMAGTTAKNDWLTVAALALLAMCTVTFDHEALGHGGACLLLHGHIRLLTSSLFRCDIYSKWIDAAGPAMNLFVGILALIARILVPIRFSKIRLFLILLTAFSFFWEGGYLIHAMHRQNGDLYFFVRSLLGNVTVAQRWIGAALGLALYLATIRLTARAFLTITPSASAARAVARTSWLSAALGATLAATAGGVRGLPDAVMEIGLASFPLLFIPVHQREMPDALSSPPIARSYPVAALALIVFAVFVATLGRGI
jgi:small basic protein